MIGRYSSQYTYSNPGKLGQVTCYLSLILLSSPIFAKTSRDIQVRMPTVSLFQIGNASALFSGAIQGEITYRQLKTKGNFGLGTFNNIDGEMVALDGHFYKISQQGETIPVDANWKTPFAELVKFSQHHSLPIVKVNSYAALKQLIKSKLDNHNIPYAIKITGTFHYLKLRSRSQRKALQTIDVMEETYTAENIKGTLVGFWFPDYLLSLTIPAFHFHFIADNRKLSGHVLELKANSVEVSINKIKQIELVFPQTQIYKNANITAATQAKYNNAQMNEHD